MAFGFTPKHQEILELDNASRKQIIVSAAEAAKELGWNILYISDAGLKAYTNKGAFSWNSNVELRVEENNILVKAESAGSEMMDWGKNKKLVARFVDSFKDVLGKLSDEEVESKYAELQPSFPAPEEDILMRPPATASENMRDMFSLLIPSKDFFITPILIDLNLLVFLIMVISGAGILAPDNHSLIAWGANFKPSTLSGEWWRLLTACFVHIGIIHLLLNLYALLYIGILLEPLLGRVRYLTVYLCTGIASSLTSLWWHDLTISAGASGAIFGLYGVFLALLTTNLIDKQQRKQLLTSIGIFVVYNLAYGMKAGIDNAAHIGGLISGLVFGFALVPSLKQSAVTKLSTTSVIAIAVITIAASAFALASMPNDIGEYDKKNQEFAALEQRALSIYKLSDNTPKDVKLSALKNDGIDCWNKCITLMNESEKLNIPEVLHARNKKTIQYCQLRRNIYNLLYQTIDQETTTYEDSISIYNQQLQELMQDMETK